MRRLAMAALLIAVGACRASSNELPSTTRVCAPTAWHRAPAGTRVELVTDWTGWRRGTFLDARADGWRTTTLDAPPGERAYAFVETTPDGTETWTTDDAIGTTTFATIEGVKREVTWIRVDACDHPTLRVDTVTPTTDGHATIEATFLSSSSGEPIDTKSLQITDKTGASPQNVTIGNMNVANGDINVTNGHFKVTIGNIAVGKHTWTLQAKDTAGRDADEAVATVWMEPAGHRAWDWRDAVIYQLIVDRWRAADGSALATPSTPASRAGGTIEGVTKSIVSGELEALGVNVLWLSPLYANPDGTFPGSDGRQYSSYHGYWPIDARRLEPKLASGESPEQALDALIDAAHARGMRVLFDVVPNHVHLQHPYWIDHRRDGWFDDVDGTCVCGSATCDWGTHIEDCWFTPYLPDLDWTNPSVADQVSSDVRWWIDRFDGDGVRIDAVPMMPRAANRRISWEIRAKYDYAGARTFVLGENFVAANGWDFLRYELGPFGLDSEFDFPIMWALRSTIARRDAGLDALDASIATSQSAWSGSGAVMAPMIGNHDVPRFASVSSGDDGGDGWSAAPQSNDPTVYAKQKMALGAVYTLPGAPVLFYGDEIGLAGRGDPDVRRVMPSDASLSDDQRGVRAFVQLLGKMRACSSALRRGTYRSLGSDAEHLVYARESDDGDVAIVALSRDGGTTFEAPLPGISAGDWIDVVSGDKLAVTPARTAFPPGALAFRLYVPAQSACAPEK